MKKFFTLTLMAAALLASAKTYTMADLATLVPALEDGTGVAVVNGEYVITLPTTIPEGYSGIGYDDNNIVLTKNYFSIKAPNELKVQSGEVVRFVNAASIEIEGSLEAESATFAAAEGSEATAKGFRIIAEGASVNLKNCVFNYVGITYGNGTATGSFKADGCTFNKHNGKSANSAIMFSSSSTGNLVTNCTFKDNTFSSIASGANVACGITFSKNIINKSITSTRLYPCVNLTATGSYDIVIDNNKVHGPADITRAGGIALGCLLGNPPTGDLYITNNFVEDCSYGITLTGPGKVTITGNTTKNNKYISDPMYGGSGINITCNSTSSRAEAYVADNHIEGNYWGITAVGPGAFINAGKVQNPETGEFLSVTDPEYNPGNNTFDNNGNGNPFSPCDFGNSSPNIQWAQGNTWSVDVQVEEHIAANVFDVDDDASNGKVYFMPPAGYNSIEGVRAADAKTSQRYNILGQPVDANYRGIVIENGKKLIVK